MGTFHEGRVTRLRQTSGRGGTIVTTAVFVNFGAPRDGLLKGLDICRGLSVGDIIKIKVEETKRGDHGEMQFDLRLVEVVFQAKPTPAETPAPAPAQTAPIKYEDRFKGVEHIGKYVIIPAAKLPAPQTQELIGLPGLAQETDYINHPERLVDYEVVADFQERKLRMMVTEGFEQVVGELEESQEASFRIQFSKDEYVYFSLPESPGIIAGKARVVGNGQVKAGEILKCKLKPRAWGESEIFQELFFGRLEFEDINPTVKGRIDHWVNCTFPYVYVLDPAGPRGGEQPTVAIVPTILLDYDARTFGGLMDFVIIDSQYHAYPKKAKELVENLLKMVNEAGELTALPIQKASAIIHRAGEKIGKSTIYAKILCNGKHVVDWLMIEPHSDWFYYYVKGTPVKIRLNYEGRRGASFNEFVADLSQHLLYFTPVEQPAK
jgi:hypothetical protein